jgi:hypothetical protein
MPFGYSLIFWIPQYCWFLQWSIYYVSGVQSKT